jgi:5-methylcytosine-specific restriction protein A
MATKALRLCNHVGCSQLVSSGYCDKHKKTYVYKRDKSRQRMYDKRWQKARVSFLIDHEWCEDCLDAGDYTAACEVHHTIKHSGDYNIFWNISKWRALCKSCHSRRSGRGE